MKPRSICEWLWRLWRLVFRLRGCASVDVLFMQRKVGHRTTSSFLPYLYQLATSTSDDNDDDADTDTRADQPDTHFKGKEETTITN